MESYIAASNNTTLVSALSFEQPKIAPYLLQRKQCTIAAAGGDVYGPDAVGAKVARFSLSTSGPFLDLSTLCN